MVGVAGFEPTASKSQTSRAASCATPRLVKIFNFSVKSVSGQICGQKFFAETHGGGKARKREKNGDFASFRRSAHEAVTRSQSKRVTVTLHPDIRCAYRCRRMKCHDFRTPLLSYHNTRQKSSTNCKKAVYLTQIVSNTIRQPQNA